MSSHARDASGTRPTRFPMALFGVMAHLHAREKIGVLGWSRMI